MGASRRPAALMPKVRFVPSLRDSPQTLGLPGTDVPGYRLFRPYGTASLLASKLLQTSGRLRQGIQLLPGNRPQ